MDFTWIIWGALYSFIALHIGILVYDNRSRSTYIFHVWRRFSIRLLFNALITYTFVIGVALLLDIYTPILRWGWYILLSGKPGNFLFSAPLELNWKTVTVAVLLLLILLAPFLAELEERVFRKGRHKPKQWIKSSVVFGLVHLIMGVSIYVGIALIFAGFGYTYEYLRAYRKYKDRYPYSSEDEAMEAGVESSTAMHTLANTVLLSILVVFLIMN